MVASALAFLASFAAQSQPLSADETRDFMKRLATTVEQNHLKKDPQSEQKGMIYEYFDVKRKCPVEEVQELRLVPSENDSCELLADVEVKKNYTIAELADSLFRMANLARSGNYTLAQSVLDVSVSTAYRRYPNMEDEDIRFIIDIVEGYRRDLRVYNEYSRKHDCGSCR